MKGKIYVENTLCARSRCESKEENCEEKSGAEESDEEKEKRRKAGEANIKKMKTILKGGA